MSKLTTEQQAALQFHNYMHEDEILSEDMFLIAWGEFNIKYKQLKYNGFRDDNAKLIFINSDRKTTLLDKKFKNNLLLHDD